MWSARPSPRAGSPRSTWRRPRPRPACSRSSPLAECRQARQGRDATRAELLGGPEIEHYHQAIALVVAETFEQARAAAQLIRVDYERDRAARSISPPRSSPRSPQAGEGSGAPDWIAVGDFEGAFAAAPVKLDADLHHARPEPRDDGAACVDRGLARRQAHGVDLQPDDRLERRATSAKTLGIPKENVRLISPFIGGGFGGKLFLRADALLAALGARAAGGRSRWR